MSWTTDRWERIEALFHEAAELDAARRPAFVQAACGGDTELRAAVERMLAADEAGGGSWLEQGVVATLRGDDPLLGTRIGAFELVERIAEGGMGAVYRARRSGEDFDQEVAVKVLRLGLSTPAMRERFARERQTLARLVHPNVARLLDGGTTEQGVPFFAMELVDGVPLDRACDERALSVRERMRLFVTVCRAVHFAHQNLVVHLDLKPTNILVDRHGVPKLLDFGVAGLLSDVAAGSAIAATRSRPLTPEYASPEQLRGEPVTTAADVYSLGVVAYELLTGRRPFAPAANDLALARTVCDTDPSRPSATFHRADATATPTAVQRAAHRGARPAELARVLRGDLDRVVAKAMHKQPAERYASCLELAEDVERWLTGFPVLARDAGVVDRVVKFVRRNVLVVGAAATVLLSLCIGLVATLQAEAVARQQRDEADAARRRVEQLNEAVRKERDDAHAARQRAEHEMDHARIESTSAQLLAAFLSDTLLGSDVLATPAARAKVREVIAQRAEQYRRQFGDDAHLRANMLDALGRTCARTGDVATAEELLHEAADVRATAFGKQSLEYAQSLASLGKLWYEQGRFADAAEALRGCHRLHVECPVGVHTDVARAANDLAAAERALGNVARARELHEQALALRRRNGDDNALVAESLNNLANAEPDPVRSGEYLAEALRIRTAVLGADDPLTIQTAFNVGAHALQHGDFPRALGVLRDAVAAARTLGGRGAELMPHGLRALAWAELRTGGVARAQTAIDEALPLVPSPSPLRANVLEAAAAIADARGDPVAAVALWRETVDVRKATLPAAHRSLVRAEQSLGGALVRAGDVPAALALLQGLLARLQAEQPVAVGDVVATRVAIAAAHETARDIAFAERELLAALADAGPQHAEPVRAQLAALYRRLGRHDDAMRYAPDR
jgi:serine/threonine protein kinase/tetratricopeptide (TPR) repeat protein